MSLLTDKQDEAFERLVSKFPARYRVKATTYLRGLLKALAQGDGFIDTQVEATRDNLLVITAVGKYLDRLAGQYGVVRTQGSGVQDEDFRKLIPLLGMSPKQIIDTLNKIIDVVYGPFASHANVTCTLPEPYVLQNNQSLRLIVDGVDTLITFYTSDFVNIAAATASEITRAVTEKTNGKIIGRVISNVRTGENFVNLSTSTVGTQGFIQVLGGEVQTPTRFPLIRETVFAIATWDVNRVNGSDEMEYTVISGISPSMKTAGVQKGDWVTIRDDSGFSVENVGSFLVTFATDTSFIVKNAVGVQNLSITQNNVDDFVFYRPNIANILLTARPATVVESQSGELTVILPVTSPLVKRKLAGSHHFHGGITNAISSTVNTLTIGSTTGFPVTGGAIKAAGTRDTSNDVVSSVGATTITLIDSTGWGTSGALYSQVTNEFYYYDSIIGNQLQNVTPTPPASIVNGECFYQERYSYTGITGSTLTGVYPDASSVVGLEIVTAPAELITDYAGGFIYDKFAALTVSQEECRLAEQINQGSSRTIVNVDDVSDFLESGYLLFRSGTDKQEGPVKFNAKVGSTALILDPSHIFEHTHKSGSLVKMVRKIGATTPRTLGEDLPIYLTSTAPARDLLEQYLMDVIASGVRIRFEIRIPDQKWEVLPQLYSNDPTSLTI